LGGKDDFIISGDEHLFNLKEFKGIKVASVKEALHMLAKK
jgi:predicted nucleic acid-binding protein